MSGTDQGHEAKGCFDCLVCGLPGLMEEQIAPYGSYDICSCCGTEYGFDVQDEGDIVRVRNSWLAEGAPWFNDNPDYAPKPALWNEDVARKQIAGSPAASGFR